MVSSVAKRIAWIARLGGLRLFFGVWGGVSMRICTGMVAVLLVRTHLRLRGVPGGELIFTPDRRYLGQ